MEKYRVVFHLGEGGKPRADMALRNIQNVMDDLGTTNVEVELVANGEGVIALLRVPDLHGEQVAKLLAKGVRFAACDNTLRQMGLTQAALLDGVEVVPAGVGELPKKQAQGWAYIRP
jgi:intracellular sulfur oxidation DsrE/DsrF family protein